MKTLAHLKHLSIRIGCLLLTIAAIVSAASVTADYNSYVTFLGNDEQVILRGRLTSIMGQTENTPDRTSRFHKGIDLAAPKGTAIYAPADAVVLFANTQGNFGKTVQIKSNGEVMTKFAHLDVISVENGQQIKQGALIGRVGSSGSATKPHVHIETFVEGKRVSPSKVWQIKTAAVQL